MYIKAIKQLLEQKNIKERFNITNDNLDNINWLENNKANITKEEIISKANQLQSIEDAKPENIKKQSAIAKLKALGLDEEEVKAIIGI
jgi:hypothetical protein